jgi:hypothetical protein
MAQGFLIETKYVNELTNVHGSARNVFQGQESSRVPRVVYSILDQVNIGTIPTTPCP